MDEFIQALERWKKAANDAADAEETYRRHHSDVLCTSEAKTEAGRKAEADFATSDLRRIRNAKVIVRDAEYHTMIFYRGSAGEKG